MMASAMLNIPAMVAHKATLCGRPLRDYTHDELVQLVHAAMRNRDADLGELANMASAFNARRRADDLITGLPFITRRKGAGHDPAAR
jgi:hypothetical protein